MANHIGLAYSTTKISFIPLGFECYASNIFNTIVQRAINSI